MAAARRQSYPEKDRAGPTPPQGPGRAAREDPRTSPTRGEPPARPPAHPRAPSFPSSPGRGGSRHPPGRSRPLPPPPAPASGPQHGASRTAPLRAPALRLRARPLWPPVPGKVRGRTTECSRVCSSAAARPLRPGSGALARQVLGTGMLRRLPDLAALFGSLAWLGSASALRSGDSGPEAGERLGRNERALGVRAGRRPGWACSAEGEGAGGGKVCARLWGGGGLRAQNPGPLRLRLAGPARQGGGCWTRRGLQCGALLPAVYGCAAGVVGRGTRVGAPARASALPGVPSDSPTGS